MSNARVGNQFRVCNSTRTNPYVAHGGIGPSCVLTNGMRWIGKK